MIAQNNTLQVVPPNSWNDYSKDSYVPSYQFYNARQVMTNETIYGRIAKDKFQTLLNQFSSNPPEKYERDFIASVYIELDNIMYLQSLIPDKTKQKAFSEDQRVELEGYLKKKNFLSANNESVRLTVRDAEATGHNTGIVCDQFVSNSRSYVQNEYTGAATDYWPLDVNSQVLTPNTYPLVGNMKYLVPGDIIYYNAYVNGVHKPPIHIGFVYEIGYSGDRIADPMQVKILHATTWFSKWKVQNIQTAIDFVRDKPYSLGRMIQK
jgi:hypothetical protein